MLRPPRVAGAVLAAALGPVAVGQSATPPEGFKIAFIGDQGLGPDAQAVLELIAAEGADAVVHSGDFDYEGNPQAWDQQISEILGPCFPYFASVGNHDDQAFYGAGGYQDMLTARMNCLGVTWDGDLGVRSSHTYQGVLFVLTAPGVFGDGNDDHAPYISDQLAASDAIWRISSWHKLMEAMPRATIPVGMSTRSRDGAGPSSPPPTSTRTRGRTRCATVRTGSWTSLVPGSRSPATTRTPRPTRA
ncbi:MAG: metallophosphoesterase family protein [Planctomycetota bacterium]